MPIFIKENQELKNDMFKIPKNVLDHLNTTLSSYGNYKQSDGYKRLNTLLNKDYNKRSDKEDKLEDDGKHISFSDLKRINFDFDKMPENPSDLGFVMNGGNVMKDWAKSTLRRARNSVQSNLKTNKQNTIDKNKTKPLKSPMKPIESDGNSTVYMRENFRLNENNSYHPYYDRISDFDESYVFHSFIQKDNVWTPLIDPNMYQKALSEFTRFGYLDKFPTKYIYQWMGIIMKNTATLRAMTSIAGHSQYFPMEDFLDTFFYEKEDEWEKFKSENGEHDGFYAAWDYLESIGYDEWQSLPDGTDAISDFGIDPLEKIIIEYSENSTPEQTLVLINKALDVMHQRGDLSSMFIKGGAKSLYDISYRQNESKSKKIIVKEGQLVKLKNKLI